MPVILRVKGYRFWFYEVDLNEPVHVHVGKDGKEAKYWVTPVTIAREGRFRPRELFEIERIIKDNISLILEAWEKEQTKRVNR